MNAREKLEADVRQWLQSRLIGNDVYEIVISWLDRQANITKWEWIDTADKLKARVDELTEVRGHLFEQISAYDEERDRLLEQLERYDGDCYRGATSVQWYEHSVRLQAKVNELTEERDLLLEQIQEYAEEAANFEQSLADFEQTHMRLPVDADGVPIRPGDTMQFSNDAPVRVDSIGDSKCYINDFGWFGGNGAFYGKGTLSKCHHVQPDTVEGIIAEAMSFACEPETPYSENSKYVKQYAERIRKAVE